MNALNRAQTPLFARCTRYIYGASYREGCVCVYVMRNECDLDYEADDDDNLTIQEG